MTKMKRKFERKEFEIYCAGRAYRIIRNYDGLVHLDKYVQKDFVGWTWQLVIATSWDSKAMSDAIARDIPEQDHQAIKAAILAELTS